MNNLQSFSSFSFQKNVIDRIYESWEKKNMPLWNSLLEADEYDDLDPNAIEEPNVPEDPEEDWLRERPLTSGERIALVREFQILTKPQLAALYLKALGRYQHENPGAVERSVEDRIIFDRYVTKIPGILAFCESSRKTGKPYITVAGLSDALDIKSKTTVGRTINKFYNLLTEEYETEQESLYPKIIEAFDFFIRKNIPWLQNFAARAVQNPAEAATTRRRSSAITRELGINRQLKLGESVFELIRSFRNASIVRPSASGTGGGTTVYPFQDICKAQRNAIQKIAEETGRSAEDIKAFYNTFLIQNQLKTKNNWCYE
jgi:hypothetical protein